MTVANILEDKLNKISKTRSITSTVLYTFSDPKYIGSWQIGNANEQPAQKSPDFIYEIKLTDFCEHAKRVLTEDLR